MGADLIDGAMKQVPIALRRIAHEAIGDLRQALARLHAASDCEPCRAARRMIGQPSLHQQDPALRVEQQDTGGQTFTQREAPGSLAESSLSKRFSEPQSQSEVN